MNKKFIPSLVGAALCTLASGSYAFSGAPAVADNDYSALAEHQKTWAYQAYQKQDLLDNATPIAQGYNSSSHNAFNSSAESLPNKMDT